MSKATNNPRHITYGMGGQCVHKKPVKCFTCRKAEHMAKECRFKMRETQNVNMAPMRDMKPISCYIYKKVGHKLPQCTTRNKEKVKKVKIYAHMIEAFDYGAEYQLFPKNL